MTSPDSGPQSCLASGECGQNKDGSLYWPPRLWSPDSGVLPDGGCIVRSGESFLVNSTTEGWLERCYLEGGSQLLFWNIEPEDEDAGEAVDAGQAVRPSTDWSPPVKTEKPAEKSAPAAAVEEAHEAADAAAAKVQAVVEQPVAAVADLKNAIPADANLFTVLMGAVAVAGGAAAWKFYDSHSKRKHEQEMARIEKQDSQPGECKGHDLMKAELSTVASKVDAVAVKVEALEKKSEEQRLTMGDWDVDDFSERLEKVEKKVKKLKKAADGEEEK